MSHEPEFTSLETDPARREAKAGGKENSRDMTPALGTHGEAGSYERGVEGAPIALHRPGWADARWSYLYGPDTRYRDRDLGETDGRVPAAARRARSGDVPEIVQGPVMKPAVWTWEVPFYFWFGGIAAGSSFIALAGDLARDHEAAATARKVALAAALPCAPLLIMDLGRPERFLNMLRIFKPRSPMSMGAWCLVAFSNAAAISVAADLAGRRRVARVVGGVNALLGGYLGSYTGVLLASTAVPLWARSRLLLGPIFVCTATATGAAATRLTLVAKGVPEGSPTRHALGRIETGAMAAELLLSELNERRLGRLGEALEQGQAGRLFRFAKWAVRGGLGLRLLRRPLGARSHHLASTLYLSAGLAFRYAWVAAGRNSATDDRAVARMARGYGTRSEPDSREGRPDPADAAAGPSVPQG